MFFVFRDFYVLCIYEHSMYVSYIRIWICYRTTTNRLSIIWQLHFSDKIKRIFFQISLLSILLYGYTSWTPTKHVKKKLDEKSTRMLRAILNISWKQAPTKQQQYSHLLPTSKTIQIRRRRHAGHCERSTHELISDVLFMNPFTPTCVGWPTRIYLQRSVRTHDVD